MCGRGNCDGSCERDDEPREPDMWDVPLTADDVANKDESEEQSE